MKKKKHSMVSTFSKICKTAQNKYLKVRVNKPEHKSERYENEKKSCITEREREKGEKTLAKKRQRDLRLAVSLSI